MPNSADAQADLIAILDFQTEAGVDVALDEKDMLLDVSPDIFHTTPHYDGYPMVLAYLAQLEADTARAFLTRRWRNIAPKRMVAAWDARAGATGPTG